MLEFSSLCHFATLPLNKTLNFKLELIPKKDRGLYAV